MRYVVIFLVVMLSGLVRAQLPDGLYADFDTSMGSFTCRLDYAEAPLTCANFVGLVEGTQSWIDPTSGAVSNDPFYSGLIFHRVIDGFMIQGGCPLGTGGSGPGYAFPDEFIPTSAHYANAGTLVMANSGPDSNGSQFFISVVPQPGLDPSKYMVFGDVVDGIGVVTNIGSVATINDRPLIDVVINQIDIFRVGSVAAGDTFEVSAQPLPEVVPMNLSLNHAPAGMQVVAGVTNNSEILIYGATNLTDWVLSLKKYWSATDGDTWSSATSTNQSQEFFRASRVFYPLALSGLWSDVEGRSLEFRQGSSLVALSPAAGSGGECSIVGSEETLLDWSWKMDKYSASLFFETSLGYELAFLADYTDGSNAWSGYQYTGLAWTFVGIWTFSDVTAP